MKSISYFSVIVLSICFFLLPQTYTASAQSRNRSFIREKISYYGECRNVAITKYNGDLMLYGRNGWAATGCPSALTNALDELNEEGKYIDDVQLTEDGKWLILYGDNGLEYYDIPYSLEKKLIDWNRNQEVITSVSFNDDGVWIAISTEHIAASSQEIQDWIADGMDDYGGVWATCVTDDAIVVVYEDGYRFLGNIPSTLRSSLKETDMDIYRLKIAGEAWFFADLDGNYDYNM